jgi:ElaB/YqjD/DUF883 family membrane-anchored ribosome-binding protein
MDSETMRTPNTEASPDLAAIMTEVAMLKRDLAALNRDLKGNGSNAVACARSAVGQFRDDALRLYGNVTAQGERSVKAIGRRVEERPVASLLIAFAVGFLGSRILPHRGS